ncbi:hypothetical protein ACROYT_G001113 [Oculina patagonica]
MCQGTVHVIAPEELPAQSDLFSRNFGNPQNDLVSLSKANFAVGKSLGVISLLISLLPEDIRKRNTRRENPSVLFQFKTFGFTFTRR